MDDKTSTTQEQIEEQTSITSAEVAGTEARKAYGTAKTENLRDSGLWRLLLPGFILFSCLALFAVPLIILIPLLGGSINATDPAHAQLTWLWITMIVIEVGLAILIARGLLKSFMTQTNNYS